MKAARLIESEARWIRALLVLSTLTVALVFAGLRLTRNLDVESSLMEFLSGQILPAVDGVIEQLQSFSNRVATGAAGGLGLGFTIATCFYLFYTI